MEHLDLLGVPVPRLGFGTWQMTGRTARDAVADALALGYRHIDTAQAYENHDAIGEAIAASRLPREELFVTSKVWFENFEPDDLDRSVDRTLERLGTRYVDLLLLHWPHPERSMDDTLAALARCRRDGRARLIGVSNFTTELLDQAVSRCPERLAVNQVEYHPFLDQQGSAAPCDATAWR